MSVLDDNKRMRHQLEHAAFCLGAHVRCDGGYKDVVEGLNIYLKEYQKRDDNGELYAEVEGGGRVK